MSSKWRICCWINLFFFVITWIKWKLFISSDLPQSLSWLNLESLETGVCSDFYPVRNLHFMSSWESLVIYCKRSKMASFWHVLVDSWSVYCVNLLNNGQQAGVDLKWHDWITWCPKALHVKILSSQKSYYSSKHRNFFQVSRYRLSVINTDASPESQSMKMTIIGSDYRSCLDLFDQNCSLLFQLRVTSSFEPQLRLQFSEAVLNLWYNSHFQRLNFLRVTFFLGYLVSFFDCGYLFNAALFSKLPKHWTAKRRKPFRHDWQIKFSTMRHCYRCLSQIRFFRTNV